MKIIQSKDNTRIREILKWKKGLDKDSPSAWIEGRRLCLEAYRSGIPFESLLVTQDQLPEIPDAMAAQIPEVLQISADIAAKISSTVSPQGVFAIIKTPVVTSLEGFDILSGDRLILCDAVRDPGNMGSIIRSADAFGFDGVIFSADSADPVSEKVLRASMGSVFHIPLVRVDSMAGAVKALRESGYAVYATDLNGEEMASGYSFAKPCAILVGNEAHGVSREISDLASRTIRIPMAGKAESLNVASAAAILCYLAGNRPNGMSAGS